MVFKVIKAFLKASWKDRVEVIQYIFNNFKERFINYWFGRVSVHGQDIHDGGVKKLYTYSIIAGQYGRGVWFSDLKGSGLFNIIEKVKQSQGNRFQLHVDYGCGAYNEYIFNKRLTRLLLDQLIELSKQEIYKDEYDEDDEWED